MKFICFNLENSAKQIKNISSYIPQTMHFIQILQVMKIVFGALYGLKGEKLKQQINYCIEVTSLQKFVNKKAFTYSGGVKRRLNIAIGLLNSPKIIYFDEPTKIYPQSRKYI
ncbi:MAG: ATP-binding cassette domain-containing protein [Aliarcobacter sp.]